MHLEVFESINITVPKEKIYKRLGYTKGVTEISLKQGKEFEQHIEDAISLLKLKAGSIRILIEKKDALKVNLSGGVIFESRLLASLVKDCDEILCMGATAGSKIIKFIQNNQTTNLTKSAIYDAVASEYVDGCFQWIQDYFNQNLIREAKQLIQKRISCGYGDFLLGYQKIMYDILKLKDLGINITEKFILIPEKSATAVSGIISI